MYIWGGGWNKADTGAGTDGLRIGLNASWRKFCAKQKASYNYRKHRFAFEMDWIVLDLLDGVYTT